MRSYLREFRLKLGFTQEEMGRLINKSRSQYCNIEKGVRNLSAEEIVLIAIKFNLTPKEQKKLLEVS